MKTSLRKPFRERLKGFLRGLVIVLAVAYPVSLLAGVLLFRFVGERWWVSAAALYLPRFPFALPLPFLVLLLLAFRLKRWLWSMGVAAVLLLFPLMGWEPPRVPWFGDDRPSIRVLSQNVNSGFWGYDKVEAQILEQRPDIVLLQELFFINDPGAFGASLKKHFPYVQQESQFLIASRYPFSTLALPEKITFFDAERSARFVGYVVETPLGEVAIYNVHPPSPRSAFYKIRGNSGLRRAILSGAVFRNETGQSMIDHTALIAAQVRAFSELARAESRPTLIAGDLNLPFGSRTNALYLSDFQDGFDKAGSGFGHTFPNRDGLKLWLRLDRVLANDKFEFVDFEVACKNSSDHLCVVADLKLRN